MDIETNKITEIFKGHYQVILNFPEPMDLLKIINPTYKFIWGLEHNEIRSDWQDYTYTLFEKNMEDKNLKIRKMKLEFLISTSNFIELIPNINQSIRIIQTDIIPPNYLDLAKFEGKNRYDILKNKINYFFELELPGATDYAPLVSPNIEYLEHVIDNFSCQKNYS